MTARILDGRIVAAQVELELQPDISRLAKKNVQPGLVAVRVGEDPVSAIYVRNKARKAETLGLRAAQEHYDGSISESELLTVIKRLNQDNEVDGILVQLPLPRHINTQAIINAIDPAKDVDGFNPENVGRLHLGLPSLVPCTPAGVMRLLASTGEVIAGKRAVVLGRSQIVGRPVAALLLNADATVTICHSKTPDLERITREADIIVSAAGKPFIITASMVGAGAIVVDVGINRIERGSAAAGSLTDELKRAALEDKGSVLVGDVDFDPVREKASWITPVPGGVGPMTIVMLMRNTVMAALERRG